MKSLPFLSTMSLALAGSLLAPSVLAAESSALQEERLPAVILPQPPAMVALPVATTSQTDPSSLAFKAATASISEPALMLAATSSLAPLTISSSRVEKANSLPFDFTKMPTVPHVGLKLGLEMGPFGKSARRIQIQGAQQVDNEAFELGASQFRAEWAPLGLGAGASLSGFGPRPEAFWPGSSNDLYLILPGLRFGYRNEAFGDLQKLSGVEQMDKLNIGSLFGGLYSDGPLLVDALRFGYDLNLGVGLWGVPSGLWHLNGGGEAFIGYKYESFGVDLGYRYALSTGNAPTTINPLGLAASLLGIGEKPAFTMGTDQGGFLRTKIYW